MMSGTGLRFLDRFGKACWKILLNGELRAKKPVTPRFAQNQNAKSVSQLTKTFFSKPSSPRRANFVSKPVSDLLGGRSFSSLNRPIKFGAANRTGRIYFSCVAFGFVGKAFAENDKSSPSPEILKHLGSLEDLTLSFKEYKQEEPEVIHDFENDIAHGGKSLIANESNDTIITFTTTDQRRSLGKDVFPIRSEEDCESRESNPTKCQEEKHKKEEAEVTQDFENDTEHGGKPMIAKKLNGATSATTDQRRSPDGKAVLLKYSEEVCENKELKPAESQEKDKPSVHSKDTTNEGDSYLAAKFAKLKAEFASHLPSNFCKEAACRLQFPASECELLECRCAGIEFLELLSMKEIINKFDVTNLQMLLSMWHQDKLNQDFLEPYQKSIGDDQYEQHKVKHIMTWEDVNKSLKKGQKYAAMRQRNTSQHKQGAPHGENSQREASTLQSNVEEGDRGNLSFPSSVCGQSVLTTACNDFVPSNVLGKSKDAQRPSKAGVKKLLQSVGKSFKSFQINPKQTVKSASGSLKSRLKSRVNSFKALLK